jgi:hypothetical protein
MITWLVMWLICAPIVLRLRWKEISTFSYAERIFIFIGYIAVFAIGLIFSMYRYWKIAKEKDNE